MAKKITVELVDDFDGESRADETVSFAVDGINYEADLSDKNAAAFRAAIGPWVAASRRIGGRRHATRRGHGNSNGIDTDAIREWAKRNGHHVAKRGRISRETVDAYHADQNKTEAPKAEQAPAKASGGSRSRASKQQPADDSQPAFSGA